MITILCNLEVGYKSSFEHLAFRQLKGAYGCGLITVPHHYLTFQEALDSLAPEVTRVFMLPPYHHWEGSIELSEFLLPEGDVAFILGSPQQIMTTYIHNNDLVLHITTKGAADMMAVCVAAQVLYVHG